MKSITDEYGAVSILVNNAGITKDNLLMMMKEDQWNDIIDTNLTSIYRLSKAVVRTMMKARKGRIINIASVVGLTGNPGQTNYSATKAGMLGFTKSLAREIGSRNITVNCVAPGFIDTDMTRELPEEQREALAAISQRAALALEDRYQQELVLSSLESLTPQVEKIQHLRAAARYDGTQVLSLPDSELDIQHSELSKWVKDALSHYWGGPKLTQSPLLNLQVVQQIDEYQEMLNNLNVSISEVKLLISKELSEFESIVHSMCKLKHTLGGAY